MFMLDIEIFWIDLKWNCKELKYICLKIIKKMYRENQFNFENK